jgi:L-galactose dehydrogenase
VQYRELGRTGLKVSVLSLGSAAFGEQYGKLSTVDVEMCVRAAIDAGVNLIDTSAYYGKGLAESRLGDVLGAIPQGRDKVYLCTKAGRLDRNDFDFTPTGMQHCFEGSLRRLKTDSVDILLAHDIEFANDFEAVFTDTADCLHKLKRQGKCRFIGMSGLPLALLRRAIESCDLDVVISYAHYTLQNQRLLTELLPIAQRHGVGVLNASPLCLGLLTNQGPPPWHPGSPQLKAAARQAAELCKQRGKDISFLGMQFCANQDRITSTVTGAANARELLTNLTALSTPIDLELLRDVQAILAPVMNETWPNGNWHDVAAPA